MMANKINAKLILELKASGLSRNQIAATRHMSKYSVSDVINIAEEKVDLRVTDTKVEIYSGSDRIATHTRFAAGRKKQYSTHPEDMPEKFKFTPWNEERIQKWASPLAHISVRFSRGFSDCCHQRTRL